MEKERRAGETRYTSIEASIDELTARFTLHEEMEKEVHKEAMAVVNSNTEAVTNLVKDAKALKELLNAWNTANGAIKALSIVGSVFKWLAAIAVVITGTITFFKS